MLDVLTSKLYKLSKPVAPCSDVAKIVKNIYSQKYFAYPITIYSTTISALSINPMSVM